jgi:hypothetical protein
MLLRFLRGIFFRGHPIWVILAASTLIYLLSLTFVQRDENHSYYTMDADLLKITLASYAGMKICELLARAAWSRARARKVRA